MKFEPCEPPAWASTGHLQTIFGHILPSPKLRSKGRMIEIPVPKDDKLTAFVQEGTSDTVVYIFHGLAGSTDSPYMHRTSILAQAQGHTVIMLNHRGCGEGKGLASEPYHSGRAEDLSAAIAKGRELFPNKRHVAVGFSMSGNALLLLASGARGETLPDAAIAVNAPIHLQRCSQLLNEGLNRIYNVKFYLQCRRDVVAAKGDTRLGVRIPYLSTIYAFDDLYTAPAGGFTNREDYYSTCSTFERLDQIKIPTLVMTAKDDPFVEFSSYAGAKLAPNVHLHVEDHGGHMGYLTQDKTPLGTRRWQDYAIHEALKQI